jgi:hypothetical protein
MRQNYPLESQEVSHTKNQYKLIDMLSTSFCSWFHLLCVHQTNLVCLSVEDLELSSTIHQPQKLIIALIFI